MATNTLDRKAFWRVREARELLREHSAELVKMYLEAIQDAKANGESEVAIKAIQWLVEHMPADEDGTRIIDASVDKKVEIAEKDNRPTVQIGISLGGVNNPKQVAAAKSPKPKAINGEIIDA